MIEFLSLLKKFLKQYWPGLAVAFFNYEEDRVDHETKEKEAAQLVAQNLQDEKTIRAQYDGKSDADVINNIAGGGPSSGGTKPGGSS